MSLLDFNQEFLDLLPVGVYGCLAPNGQILFRNRRAIELWGRDPGNGDSGELYCGSFRMYRPDGTYLPHSQCPMAQAVQTGAGFQDVHIIIERQDGQRLTACVNIRPVLDDAGRVLGVINVFHPAHQLNGAAL